jgi:3-deoxy-D-manno-octulosonic-acid transferase
MVRLAGKDFELRMTLFFYNVALLAGMAASLPWWLWRMATVNKYRDGWRERLGRVPRKLEAVSGDTGQRAIWLHAVSVGEVLAVSRLVKELDAALPDAAVAVSTTTRTGQALAREHFGLKRVFYCPLDLPWAVRAYLNALQPKMLVLAETEFWPNLLNGCFRRGIPVVVVNARISNRSWPRYKMLRSLWRPLLSRLRCLLAQSETDAQRLRAIGCAAERVTVSGNLKFDVRVAEEAGSTEFLRRHAGGLRFVVAGSTHEGEEEALLDAWKRVLQREPRLVLVLAPRHPERFSAVAKLCEERGFSCIRRTDWQMNPQGEPRPLEPGEIVLLDTIGELASVYSLASVAFVGGSLGAAGGHNPLEPAQFGVPIAMGTHYANFTAITDLLRRADAVRIARKEELAEVFAELLHDRTQAEAMGARARRVFEEQAGATERCVAAIREVLEEAPAASASAERGA